MGRLAGFTASKVLAKLRAAGFVFDRMAKGSHEIWYNPETRARVTVPNHPGDMPEGTVQAIARQAGLDTDTFLKL